MSCCPIPFCQPPEEGSWFLALAADAASLGCISGSETRSRHRGTLAEANARITPNTAGDFCYKYRCVSPVSLQPWSQMRIAPMGLTVLHGPSPSLHSSGTDLWRGNRSVGDDWEQLFSIHAHVSPISQHDYHTSSL